ncbi:uncharacterized protein ACA1_002730 [Acanthamoeba castellanii str. Neff]|uniref:Uncharacterized protein n=1 Tax=Acanthamoeba castellanii (strain ATCC 30010 / Neff) TaxID=1257118 RepID=L8GGZ3_ACACF|nr:uncharacterized protein ACA1_002730 [Acanthamoeba castellanii str. Neff]ELR12252.1 hypothetical protein ACA1_002730 [Acanthamoeba castellanii str. Neff]
MTPPLGRLRHWQRGDDELPLHFYHASLSEGSGLLQEERVSTIEKPVYIPLDERQDTERKRASAFRFAFTHLSPRKSRFILYPQSFSQMPGCSSTRAPSSRPLPTGFWMVGVASPLSAERRYVET